MSSSRSGSRRRVSYPALRISQNRQGFYFLTIPVDDLFPYCFVSRRDEDPIVGFQRALNEQRADDIARYLAEGTGSIPSNIVLSAQAAAKFVYNSRPKTVTYERTESAFLVLDGQHRLWGYQKCRVRHRVPVAIYRGLARAHEAKLFIDINTTQRGVPAALLLDIKQVAEIESHQEVLLRELFDKLQSDSRSPLAGKLSAAKSAIGRISRVTFNRAIGLALTKGVLLEAEPQLRYPIVLNYLRAFDAELEDKRLLVRSKFFEAMFEMLDEVVRSAIDKFGSAKQSQLQEVVRPLARLDLEGKSLAQTSVKTTVTMMQATLRSSIAISKEML